MIHVERAAGRLTVAQGPSASYRAVTWISFIVVGIAAIHTFSQYEAAPMHSVGALGLGAPLLLAVGLLWGWRENACRFDRAAGFLLVEERRLIRSTKARRMPLAMVSAVVDRHGSDARVIELVMNDDSSLIVARSKNRASPQLDSIALGVGDLLGKPVRLAKGIVIGERFEIDRLVEQGGMGVVYRAFDRMTKQPIALKLMFTPADEAEERIQRFEREIRLLASLDHPKIAKHTAHGTLRDGRAFFAMEWIEGPNLQAALAERPMALTDALSVMTGAAEAVAAVHRAGILHRDLKPSNMVLRDGSPEQLVLIDFGVARHFESRTGVTGSAALIGTPHYMAPEQASSSREILPAADVFSLGCIFYQCLTGRHPFEAAQIAGVLARILYDNPAPIASIHPQVPEPWSALVTRMLAKKPADRPRDGADLLRELTSLQPPSLAGEVPARRASLVPNKPSADQVLVCVVLAIFPARSEGPPGNGDRFESLRLAMTNFGCPMERLADGSLLATVLPRPSATDQVRIAARCAMYLRERLPEASIAVATGRAPLGGEPYVGEAVDRAAQLLEPETARSAIRIDSLTAGLLDARFLTDSRDGTNLLVGERTDLDESRPLLGKPTPCVGRELELVQLESVMASAVAEGAPKAVVLVGPPGIGKSRLRHELLRRIRRRYPDTTVIVGHGDPLNAGSPYVLLSDALRRHAEIRIGDDPSKARAAIVERLCQRVHPSHRQRVAEFLGEVAGVHFPAESSPPLLAARADRRVMGEQIALAFTDWMAAECAAHPVLLVLEDAQWGDAPTVKLLEATLRHLKQGGLLVIALGRPELEDTFPHIFGASKAMSISLGALGRKAIDLLVRGVLDGIDDESIARIARLSSGNALFLEELVRAAAAGKAGDVPETVLAMLQARLSRLEPEPRMLLRACSVLGETFWASGVDKVCAAWGKLDHGTDWLSRLAEAELIEQHRSSRFPGEIEYGFHHALVCEAAYGLLTDADRRAGHLAAGSWLEAAGEVDAIVLARHADEGGDGPRAVSFLFKAAQQSLASHDFVEALARATKGLDRGAVDATRGALLSVRCAALYSLGRFPEATEAGSSALALLPRGGVAWCSTIEALMQMLPNVGEAARVEALAEELHRTTPEPEARMNYVRVVHSQLFGHAVTGERARGEACLRLVDGLASSIGEYDVVTRGHAKLWRSIFAFVLGPSTNDALALVDEAASDFSESQVMYRLAFAYVVRSSCYWAAGDLARAEREARRAREVAAEIHDEYHLALGAWYVGLALAEQPDEAKLAEAEVFAARVVPGISPPMDEPLSLTLTARVALTRGDWARAEADARKARGPLLSIPPWGFLASSHLVEALVRQGRSEEALVIARQDVQILNRIGSPMFTEVIFRVAFTEALLTAGERQAAESHLRETLRLIDMRTSTFGDPDAKRLYLARYENRRAAELAVSSGLRLT